MIKRTLYFGNPVYLSKKTEQLNIDYPKEDNKNTYIIPIEDVGVVVLDNQQITITQGLMQSLLQNNAAVISCNEKHMPVGLFMPLCSNTLQAERFTDQLSASLPLKKQLWQQTICAKIKNQAALLKGLGKDIVKMNHWVDSVKTGDRQNHEARAAAYYWSCIFEDKHDFRRERSGEPPNNLLNYGYAILRATVARGLVATGLLPTSGIFHHNRYNAFALADDIMEPYRPYVDKIVCQIIHETDDYTELTTDLKKQLLEIPALDIFIDGQSSPLMIGLQRTTSSLAKCFAGETRKIIYPEFV